MLVLSRKQDESLVINGQIRITILKTSGAKVRLGIDAPQSVDVLRSELVAANLAPRKGTRRPPAKASYGWRPERVR